MDVEEVRGRAVAGVAALGLRSVVMVLAALGGNVVLARLLTPRDFGIVAIGSTLVLGGTFIADGGIGTSLIGRSDPPKQRELEAVLGAQLLTSTAVAAAAATAALFVGGDGPVIALMLVALPLISLRVPQAIVLERELEFRKVATVEALELVVQYAWAVAAVAAGAGVWGLASAAIVRSATGSIAMTLVGRVRSLRPRLSWSETRPLLGFGVRFQAVPLLSVVRDQLLIAGVAVLAGLSAVGVWALAVRIMQVPILVGGVLQRVAYPAMARLLDAGRDPRPAIERGIGATAVVTAPIVTAIAAGAPALVPPLLGDRWDQVPELLAGGSAALMIATPVSVAMVGWLYSVGDAGTVLRSTAWFAGTWVVAGLILVATVGLEGLAAAWLVSAFAYVYSLGRVARKMDVRVGRLVTVPVAVFGVGVACGWLLSSLGGALAGTVGVAAAELVVAIGFFAFCREDLRLATTLAREGLRGSPPTPA
jgi:O-antigen/teichoic acid export membrane protein